MTHRKIIHFSVTDWSEKHKAKKKKNLKKSKTDDDKKIALLEHEILELKEENELLLELLEREREKAYQLSEIYQQSKHLNDILLRQLPPPVNPLFKDPHLKRTHTLDTVSRKQNLLHECKKSNSTSALH